jgi:hypothetical protein
MAGWGQQNFSADIKGWIGRTREDTMNVLRMSAQDVIDKMQTPTAKGGNMPVDTGFLRSSLVAKIGDMPSGMKTREKSGKNAYASENAALDTTITLVINNMKAGDVLWAIYLANYAGYQEYGTKYMTGHAFVRLAAQNWQSIVAQNVAKVRNSR